MSKFLWVPPSAQRRIVEDRQRFASEINSVTVQEKMRSVKALLDEWNYHLKQIDERLELIRAQETIPAGIPMKPGYYHVVRWNEGAAPSVWPIEGEHGEYVEPTSKLLEIIKKNDLWDPRNFKRLVGAALARDEALERDRMVERQLRQAEIMERVAAATRTQVSMSRDIPWAQNAAGFKRTKGIKKKAK